MNIDTLSELLTKVSSKIQRKLSAGEIKKFPDFCRENVQYTSDLSELVAAYVKEINLVESFTVSPSSDANKLNVNQTDNKTEESDIVNDSITAYENDFQSAQSNELVPVSQYSNRDISINISSFLGIDTFEKLIHELNPKVTKKKAYVCLDSRYAKFLDNCTKLQWNYSNALITTDNSTSVIGNVRNVTSVRMLSMVVRKFTSIAQRASICIEEFSAQSFILPGGRRFHFVGLLNDLKNNTKAIDFRNDAGADPTYVVVPDFTTYDKYELLAGYKFNDGIYRFNKPITDINTLTISIGDPFVPVVIPKYEFLNVSVEFIENGMCGYDRLRLTFDEPHNHIGTRYFINTNLIPAYRINPTDEMLLSLFIDGLTSNVDVDAPYVADANTREFTLIEIVDAFTIDAYFSTGTEFAAGITNIPLVNVPTLGVHPERVLSKVRVRINSYRVIMNFELEYIAS